MMAQGEQTCDQNYLTDSNWIGIIALGMWAMFLHGQQYLRAGCIVVLWLLGPTIHWPRLMSDSIKSCHVVTLKYSLRRIFNMIKPGRIKPAAVDKGQTCGWTFTVIIGEVEFAAEMNIRSAAAAKRIMRSFIESANPPK
jgi:hypothetical protein